jgi:hypothetical protein
LVYDEEAVFWPPGHIAAGSGKNDEAIIFSYRKGQGYE